VNNLKSIGNIAKFSLLGLWLISIGLLFALGVRQAAEYSHSGSVLQEFEIPVGNTADTLVIKMKDLGLDYLKEGVRFGSMSLVYDENDKKILVADEVDLKVRKSDNGLVSLSIRKEANGHNTLVARERAKNILFGHSFVDNEIVLDEYLSTDVSNKAR